ncbi:MAG: alpha/beta hydrolase, partial [Mesorhizobium sp.]
MVLIHQAPISARTLESRIERLSADFFCIAPDLPGLGQSDALGGGLVTVERMAKTIVGLLDRLGIEKAVFYGQHTGALVATEIAASAPDRMAAVLIGGMPIYTAEESSQRVTSYAPPLAAPDWDGGHLSWLWYRYREQFIYWPWNSKEPRIRATCAIPPKAFLHDGAGEIAARHASYAAVYHAAFDYDAEGVLNRVSVPMHFILDLADSLSLKIELAAAANPALKRWPGATQDIEAIERKVAIEAARGLKPQPPISTDALSTRRIARRWQGGAVDFLRVGKNDARPCLVLPPFPVGARGVLPELESLPGRSFIVADMKE